MSGLSGPPRVTTRVLNGTRNASTGSMKLGKQRALSERLRARPPFANWKKEPYIPKLVTRWPSFRQPSLAQARRILKEVKTTADVKFVVPSTRLENLPLPLPSKPRTQAPQTNPQEKEPAPPKASSPASPQPSFLSWGEARRERLAHTANIQPAIIENVASAIEERFGEQNQQTIGFSGEGEWEDDGLTPGNHDDPRLQVDGPAVTGKRRPPPHMRPPIPYTRRVEGLFEPDFESDRQTLEDVAPDSEHRPVATLAHGLERVLFNPGVHWMQDPRSQVYNFTTWLENIPKVEAFDFGRLEGFIPSSRDKDLMNLAKRENRKFAGSTSSLSGMLAHAYFLISEDKPVDLTTLSRHFEDQSRSFTAGQRMPASVRMNYSEGVYTIDSDSSTPGSADKNILTWMGTLLEKFLTATPDVFKTFLKANTASEVDMSDTRRDAYRYAKSEHFVMRSQLDCKDHRLPGTGVFDIKTRAVLPIRLDNLNHKANSGYIIRSQYGPLESFEKEYYDLIRAAFLKYSYQVRIGNMDGVMVAYHNTERILGFQYISLQEMEERLYGETPGAGDKVFEKVVNLVENVALEAIGCFPNQSIKCTFETLDSSGHMQVIVEPAEWDEDSEEPKPIALLDVTCVNYLGERVVTGSEAIEETGAAPWSVHWSIQKLALPIERIRTSLHYTRQRQIFSSNLPEGVTMDGIEKMYTELNYGGKELGPSSGLFDIKNFQHASRNVKKLRVLAAKGRADTEARAGRPKIVWNAAPIPQDHDAVAHAPEEAEGVFTPTEATIEETTAVEETEVIEGAEEVVGEAKAPLIPQAPIATSEETPTPPPKSTRVLEKPKSLIRRLFE